MVISRIDADEAPLARKLWAELYRESIGEDMVGYREHELLQTPYTSRDDNEIEYYMCVVDGTQYQYDKFVKLIEKYKIHEKCPSYVFEVVSDGDTYKHDNNLREVT